MNYSEHDTKYEYYDIQSLFIQARRKVACFMREGIRCCELAYFSRKSSVVAKEISAWRNKICFINRDNESARHKSRIKSAADEEEQRKKKERKKRRRNERTTREVPSWNAAFLSTYHAPQNSCALSGDKIKVEHGIDRHDLLSAIDTR